MLCSLLLAHSVQHVAAFVAQPAAERTSLRHTLQPEPAERSPLEHCEQPDAAEYELSMQIVQSSAAIPVAFRSLLGHRTVVQPDVGESTRPVAALAMHCVQPELGESSVFGHVAVRQPLASVIAASAHVLQAGAAYAELGHVAVVHRLASVSLALLHVAQLL